MSRRLEALSAVAGTRAARLARPMWLLRILAGLLVLGGVVAGITAVVSLRLTQDALTWSELIQAAEAGLGNLVYAGVAIFFLFTVGIRIRRRRTRRRPAPRSPNRPPNRKPLPDSEPQMPGQEP